jgi:transporter family-2 protein
MISLKYALWAALAGGVIPLMGIFNARLGGVLGSPFHAPIILFVAAFMAAVCVGLALTQSLPDVSKLANASPQDFVGGLIVCFYVTSITLLAPRMGIGNFIMFALCAQLIVAAAIDYFGLFGAPMKDISLQRLGGILLMLAGLAVAQSSV